MSTAQVATSQTQPSHQRARRASPELKARKKFLRYFPGGFDDETYLDWERNYKWAAHERWDQLLGRQQLRSLLDDGEYVEIARRATSIES